MRLHTSRPAGSGRAVLAYDAVRAVATGLEALGPLGGQDLDDRLPDTRRLRNAVAGADFDQGSARDVARSGVNVRLFARLCRRTSA